MNAAFGQLPANVGPSIDKMQPAFLYFGMVSSPPQISQVSVVIPTYNRAELLRAALESVVSQTLLAREIVVADSGSDSTPEVVQHFISAGAPVTYLRCERPPSPANPRSAARNLGVAATTAPLLAFLDSDDLWVPRRLEVQLSQLELSPGAGFAFCNVQRFDEQGPLGSPVHPPGAEFNGNILPAMLLDARAASSSLLVKREAFEQVGGFAHGMVSEDYELMLRLAERYPASYVPEPLVLMREHHGRSIYSYKESQAILLDYVRIVEGFLASHPGLTARAKASAKRGLANVHFKLARLYLEHGDRPAARRHLMPLVRLRPWDRRALTTLVQTLGAGR